MNKLFLSTSVLLCLSVIQLFAQQTPYNGTPTVIPGQIEAEDFDNGGEGVAFHDTDDTNEGGVYRTTGVDVEACGEGGYNVGWIAQDEWLEYTVNVLSSNAYNFYFRVASESAGGDFHVEFDGVDVTGVISFDSTGGWQTYVTISAENIALTEGQHVMRFYCNSSGFNINSIIIESALVSDPPEVIITSPLDNTTFSFGTAITITVAATDSDGTVSKVMFYADGELIGEDASVPYEIIWLPGVPENYDLIAEAMDNTNTKGVSKKIDITVLYPQYANSLIFSHAHGFYSEPFTLTISSESGSTAIKYTLDGSDPMTSSTAMSTAEPANISINPASTSGRGLTPGIVVRAVALSSGSQNSLRETKTYLFIDEVSNQAHPGSSWPDPGVNGQQWHYEMNQDVVNDANYSELIDDALLDIPSISLVTDLNNLFDPDSGIYVNAQYHGEEWERPTSIELLNPDGSEGFQINAGLRIRGGWSRHDEYPKHAFRLFFRERYGKAKLEYPLFEDEGVDEFKKLDLRTSQNYAWSNGSIWDNTMNRDVFSRDLQGQMGQPYTRSRYYHLYINGEYWGLYQSQERPEANFAESYFGGNDEEYDVVKVDIGDDFNLYDIEATDGTLDAWEDVWEATQTGFISNANYFQLEGKNPDGTINPFGRRLVDIDNLIEYMIIIFYTGNFDAPVTKFSGENNPNNFYAIYNREENDGFIFLAHDNEHTLHVDPESPGIGIEEDRVNIEYT
ncbi:MAG TPA: carbohydrate-binding protein, partial [Caldithrix sp.]|nr:carbohydrate-binding protein [Caldithrix sp.]